MLRLLSNILIRLALFLSAFYNALGSVLSLILGGLSAALFKNISGFISKPKTLRHIFSVLRFFCPNVSLSKILVKSYDNSGTVIVSQHQDVLDVLNRNSDFEVVYGARMEKLTNGSNFFLGMQPGWDYTRDHSAMSLAARRTDVAEFVVPRARELAQKAVEDSAGRIDIVSALTLHIPWDMTEHYFGVGGDAKEMQKWTTHLFYYLFQDLKADEFIEQKALGYAQELREYLDGAIKNYKKTSLNGNKIVERCLALQAANTPGMSDEGIRNNLLGLLIGAIPTISKACCLVMDELLNRPEQLAGSRQAALQDDDALIGQYIWEALRFNPFGPVIYRRATQDSVIAKGTTRALNVKKGQMVFAATASACFDRHVISSPGQFRTDRRWEDYMNWGYGMHTCFGSAINKAIIPQILKPLLKLKNLRRADAPDGVIMLDSLSFPISFILEFEREA